MKFNVYITLHAVVAVEAEDSVEAGEYALKNSRQEDYTFLDSEVASIEEYRED